MRFRIARSTISITVPGNWLDRYYHLEGQDLADWLGAATRLVEALAAVVGGLRDLPQRLTAYRDANSAGPWWPSRGLVIVCERRATRANGVLRWADGTALNLANRG
jgi:hypothetical protein